MAWYRLLRMSMDTTVEKRGPKPGANRNAAIFYVIYFITFPFFFLNIFVALIVVTFKEHGDDELLTAYDLDRNQVLIAFISPCISLILPGALPRGEGPGVAAPREISAPSLSLPPKKVQDKAVTC